MSHTLDMYVKNISQQYSLVSYIVTHIWDSNGNTLQGANLAIDDTSSSQTITSGYVQYDWYTITATFSDANNTTKTMNFYCNSSHSQDKVVLEISASHVNCRYYVNGVYDTGCLDKSWT
jgi:hypothetical protein